MVALGSGREVWVGCCGGGAGLGASVPLDSSARDS